MRNPLVRKRFGGESGGATKGLLRRALRRLRRPFGEPSPIEQAAALNRAERIFEINFRSKWIR